MIGTMLGVDTQDPSVARELSDQGAELISSSTHDWEQVAPQHRAFAALAARASGVPVVRADWHYGSAIFGRDGSPIADAGEEKSRTVLSAEVAPGEPTPYARIGDVVGWVAVALSVLTWVGAHALRVARRRRAGAAAKTAGAPAAG